MGEKAIALKSQKVDEIVEKIQNSQSCIATQPSLQQNERRQGRSGA